MINYNKERRYNEISFFKFSEVGINQYQFSKEKIEHNNTSTACSAISLSICAIFIHKDTKDISHLCEDSILYSLFKMASRMYSQCKEEESVVNHDNIYTNNYASIESLSKTKIGERLIRNIEKMEYSGFLFQKFNIKTKEELFMHATDKSGEILVQHSTSSLEEIITDLISSKVKTGLCFTCREKTISILYDPFRLKKENSAHLWIFDSHQSGKLKGNSLFEFNNELHVIHWLRNYFPLWTFNGNYRNLPLQEVLMAKNMFSVVKLRSKE